jgi:hypothetical protein
MQCGIERARLDLENFARDLLNALPDPIAMQRSQCDDLEDQEIERTLGEI